MPGCQRDDQFAMAYRGPARRRDRPPSGVCANAATARSISPASPTPTARNCTPNAGAAAWITAYWPTPEAIPGSRRTAASFNRGHGDEVLACEGTGIVPCIPKTQTSANTKRGLFTVADFIYDAEKDRYTCRPAST